jgi:hypothetical protein
VNNDGNADLVAFDAMDGTATVFFGKGDGTFQTGAVYQTGTDPGLGALGDVNGDGYLDLVVPNITGAGQDGSPGSVWVFLNNGSNQYGYGPNGNGPGTFGYASNYNSYYPNQVILADLNHDGILDIVQAENYGNQVAVMYGTETGDFSKSMSTQKIIPVNGAWQIAMIDTKNTGFPDILVDEPEGNTVGVVFNGMVSTTQFLNVALDGSAADSEIGFGRPIHHAGWFECHDGNQAELVTWCELDGLWNGCSRRRTECAGVEQRSRNDPIRRAVEYGGYHSRDVWNHTSCGGRVFHHGDVYSNNSNGLRAEHRDDYLQRGQGRCNRDAHLFCRTGCGGRKRYAH